MISGKLSKLGGGDFITRIQERDFRLNPDGTLDYFDDGKVKGTIEVKGATIIDRGTYMDRQCFSIEGRNSLKEATKEYFLFADNRTTKWKWINALQAISGRYDFVDNEDANRARLHESPLNTIISRDGNAVCADCSAPFPSWAVVFGSACNTENLGGIFVCIECIGVHRGLWPDRCKEIVLDDWSGKEIEKMSQGGNVKVNEILEFNTDGAIKPNRYSLRDVREKYIKSKYALDGDTIIGDFSKQRKSQPGGPIVIDTATKAMLQEAAMNLPPRYIGVVLVHIGEASNLSASNAVIAINNGFQEVKSMPSRKKGSSDGPEWNQLVQVGIDTIYRPLYATIFDGDKIVGTSEINLSTHFKDRDLCDTNRSNSFTVNITGNNVPVNASLSLSAHLTRMA